MRQTRRHHHALLAATVAAPPLSATRLQAQTTTHQIAMLDLAPNVRRLRMVFALPVLRVQPGDTMRLIATARVHNAQSLDGMTPEGAEPFCGRINEEIELTLTVDGTQGYVCQPYAAMGMIGLIRVGNLTTNLDAVRAAGSRLHGRASIDRFAEYLAEAIAAAEGLTC